MSLSALLLLGVLGGDGTKADLVPLRRTTVLPMGKCDVDVVLRLAVNDGGREDYYCPRVEWQWEDGSLSVEESDCPPFAEAQPNDHRRVWTRSRDFQMSGRYTIRARLFKGDRFIRTLNTTVVIAGWSGYPPSRRQEYGCSPARVPPVTLPPSLFGPGGLIQPVHGRSPS